MQCRSSDKTEWFDVSRDFAYVDYFYDGPSGSLYDISQNDCKFKCEEISENCSLVSGTTPCKWFETSPMYSYRTSMVELENIAFVRLCPAGNFYYAPNLGEDGVAYCFWVVRPSVRQAF